MSRRARIAGFGIAAILTVAGVLCGVLIDGVTGEALLLALVAAGLGIALLLVFAEVGFSEERALERERAPGEERALDDERAPGEERAPGAQGTARQADWMRDEQQPARRPGWRGR